MEVFVTSIKEKYQERLINREKQWPPCHSNKLVRLETEHKYQYLEFEKIAKSLKKKERKKQIKKLENQKRSLLSFEDVEIRFTNYLNLKKINSYKIDGLKTFVEHLYFFRFHETLE